MIQEQLEKIWEETLSVIKSQLNTPTFKTWFASTKPVALAKNVITISTPNAFTKEWLESRYSSLVTGSLLEVLGEEFTVKFITRQTAPGGLEMKVTPIAEEQKVTPKSTEKESQRSSVLNSKYTFDSFVIGSSNRFAHAAALAVAEKPSRAYNPLFVYGGVGLGKTHLLQAVGHYVLENHKHLRVKYVSSEKFTNDFINSIRDKDKIVGFQKKYRHNDVLLVDDIQFLENKEATQEEFFHTFNTLHEANKQIVISSDRPPKDIATLEERLRTRFESGLIVDIQPPDLETRIAILKKRVRIQNLTVPNEILELIASKIHSNIRELEGALTRVIAFSSLTQSEITTIVVEEVLKDILPKETTDPVPLSLIQREVCRYFSLSKSELISGKRAQSVVLPRQIAMYLARDLTDLSLPKIGSGFGGRDHTTVLHANNKIEKLLNEDREVYNQIQELTNRIKQKC